MATRRKRKYRRTRTLTEASKARSMQTSWRRASGKKSSLTIEEAKKIIKAPPICQYCGKPIPWTLLSIDHVQPRSRDGADSPENLLWTDRECNMLKGNLTGLEFKDLLGFLDEHPSIKEHLVPRLKAGGMMFSRRGRRASRRRR